MSSFNFDIFRTLIVSQVKSLNSFSFRKKNITNLYSALIRAIIKLKELKQVLRRFPSYFPPKTRVSRHDPRDCLTLAHLSNCFQRHAKRYPKRCVTFDSRSGLLIGWGLSVIKREQDYVNCIVIKFCCLVTVIILYSVDLDGRFCATPPPKEECLMNLNLTDLISS